MTTTQYARTASSKRLKKLWPIGIYRVSGESMRPGYEPGDILLGWRWFRPRVHQVVVAHADRAVIKRITHVTRTHVWIVGDNRVLSTDAREIDRDQLEALIIYKLWLVA